MSTHRTKTNLTKEVATVVANSLMQHVSQRSISLGSMKNRWRNGLMQPIIHTRCYPGRLKGSFIFHSFGRFLT